jgi:cellobiose phosphorylase
VRESFGTVVFDPVLPRSLDGLEAGVTLLGRRVTMRFAVKDRAHTPRAVRINGRPLSGSVAANPYRSGGWSVPARDLAAALREGENVIEIEL